MSLLHSPMSYSLFPPESQSPSPPTSPPSGKYAGRPAVAACVVWYTPMVSLCSAKDEHNHPHALLNPTVNVLLLGHTHTLHPRIPAAFASCQSTRHQGRGAACTPLQHPLPRFCGPCVPFYYRCRGQRPIAGRHACAPPISGTSIIRTIRALHAVTLRFPLHIPFLTFAAPLTYCRCTHVVESPRWAPLWLAPYETARSDVALYSIVTHHTQHYSDGQ